MKPTVLLSLMKKKHYTIPGKLEYNHVNKPAAVWLFLDHLKNRSHLDSKSGFSCKWPPASKIGFSISTLLRGPCDGAIAESTQERTSQKPLRTFQSDFWSDRRCMDSSWITSSATCSTSTERRPGTASAGWPTSRPRRSLSIRCHFRC